jgi:hypothetical protein
VENSTWEFSTLSSARHFHSPGADFFSTPRNRAGVRRGAERCRVGRRDLPRRAAELEPPKDGKTSWDFSLIDPMMEDLMNATAAGLSPDEQLPFKHYNLILYPQKVTLQYFYGEQGFKIFAIIQELAGELSVKVEDQFKAN